VFALQELFLTPTELRQLPPGQKIAEITELTGYATL